MTLVILIFILSWQTSHEQQLNAKPLKKNIISIEEIVTIRDSDGFYDGILFAVSDQNLVIADIGNKRIHIYNQLFEQIHEFGNEGNGPGEIQELLAITVINNRIIAQTDVGRVSIFDMKGKHLTDINTFEFGSPEIVFIDNIYLKFDNQKYQLIIYNQNGELIEQIKNNNYTRSPDARSRRIIPQGPRYIQYKDSFIQSEKGEYRFSLFDRTFKKKKTFTKDFERVKRDLSKIKVTLFPGTMSKSELQKREKAARDRLLKRLTEFHDDIKSILGTINDYIILSVTSAENNSLKLNIINPEFQFYTEAELNETDQIEDAIVQNDKLIVSLKNDEIGPYLKIYDIEIH